MSPSAETCYAAPEAYPSLPTISSFYRTDHGCTFGEPGQSLFQTDPSAEHFCRKGKSGTQMAVAGGRLGRSHTSLRFI